MKEPISSAYDFPSIISRFDIQGGVANIAPYGSGHIHDTFHLLNTRPEFPDYLLQRINHYVFQNVPVLMKNIAQVTFHLRKKMQAFSGADPEKEVLTLVPTKKEQSFYQDDHGNFWRMYYFLQDTRSYDIVETSQQAYEGGRAYGKFQALLSDLDTNLLQETIPDFHNVESRLQLFQKAIQHNPKDRVQKVLSEISFVEERSVAMGTICRAGRAGELPLRITHNDTKFNNVLLNKQDKAQCVIDLDTVMPGFVAYDFGDAIRTTVNTASEDEKDLSKINVNINLFEGFTKGFLEETAGLLSDNEVHSLSLGVLLLPYLMGLRFLTDYIDGDNYYKIHFPDHNLQRARAQFQLIRKLEDKSEILEKIILDASVSAAINKNGF